ncbi:hypothetical protein TOPH_02597 [Tolypocladium ophioglossoides CBS 100239]|uniref:Uncharacterized protein n=1 Tax=Tolypocladium ophioglossoides (strain CBS 100239) TaxID=1163406 RepID=A0A0L0NFG0_TOLOC|nr:hypothetical protein TOPH_02597 [Tolypocladium ophioglossoides CBS 100239]
MELCPRHLPSAVVCPPPSAGLREDPETCFDEATPLKEKTRLNLSAECRSILVRYCAHIPRNYRYRDGIRLVFLVLRNHLGDENLGRAGGVLYEMMEVDCQYSDDPGAAFQRWRHDHMNRHTDLELPHVPHLTTVTSTIVPSKALVQWRRDHAQRYSTRLSDYSLAGLRDIKSRGCIRSKKDWAIEYTMYTSSRDGGTRIFRRIKAKELHETLRNYGTPRMGNFVEERHVDCDNLAVNVTVKAHRQEATKKCPGLPASRALSTITKRQSYARGLSNRIFLYRTVNHGKSPAGIAWLAGIPRLCSASSTDGVEPTTNATLVDPRKIPNANFARKFGLFTDHHPLPPSLKELPVAEDKVTEMVMSSSVGDMYCPRTFQGPFTPQLWFDSGLDYRWNG